MNSQRSILAVQSWDNLSGFRGTTTAVLWDSGRQLSRQGDAAWGPARRRHRHPNGGLVSFGQEGHCERALDRDRSMNYLVSECSPVSVRRLAGGGDSTSVEYLFSMPPPAWHPCCRLPNPVSCACAPHSHQRRRRGHHYRRFHRRRRGLGSPRRAPE